MRQLFEASVLGGAAGDRRDLLEGAAALAAPAIGARATNDGGASPDSPFPVVHALYWLTANLAARGPLVLVIDDAHWMDAPSLRFVDYLAGRLEGLPVTVVLAARPAKPESHVDLLARLRDGRSPVLVRPAPLSEAATTAVLHERFRNAPDPQFAAACHRATGGNPFLLHELVDALRMDGLQPRADVAALVANLGPDTVARSLLLRLARLPREPVDVVEAVAVAGLEAQVRHVAAMTDLAPEAVAEAADLLADANLLDAGRPLRFVHPMVRHAIVGELRPAKLARLHARAAAALIADGRPADQAAPHLLATEPAGDGQVVRVLRSAAATAVSQGAAEVAQAYLRRALDEPPAPNVRADVLGELERPRRSPARISRWRVRGWRRRRRRRRIRWSGRAGPRWQRGCASTAATCRGRPTCSRRRGRAPTPTRRCT